jgi:hypothetical protein
MYTNRTYQRFTKETRVQSHNLYFLLFTVVPSPSDRCMHYTVVRQRKTEAKRQFSHFFLKDLIYLQSVIIHSANGGKGEGCLVEEYSVALLC